MAAASWQCGLFQIARFALILTLFLLCRENLAAINAHQPITQMHHTAWSAKEGVIGEVLAIAQTTDGFIWVGTTGGLLRFDGSLLERYKPEAGSFPEPSWVSALLATPDGGLWIGYLGGGASFLQRGKIINYGVKEGMRQGRIRSFALDSDGIIWAAASGSLGYFNAGQWHYVGEEGSPRGLPSDSSFTLAVNQQGLWVSSSDKGVFFLSRGAQSFQQVSSGPVKGYSPTFFEGSENATLLWVPESLSMMTFPARAPTAGTVSSHGIANSAGMFLIDHDGSGWMMTRGNGVWRAAVANHVNGEVSPKDPSIETFTENEGLTSSTVYCVMEDREGDIWVGTLGGLDRFRTRNAAWKQLQPVATPRMQLVTGEKGDVWASSPQGLWDARTGKPVRGAPTDIKFSFRDSDGAIWFWSEQDGTGDLWRWSKGHFTKAMSPTQQLRVSPASDSWVPIKGPVRALARDGSGDLWVSIRGRGVFRQHDEVWSNIQILDGESYMTAYGAVCDGEGRVWMAFPERRKVGLWDHGAIRVFSDETGLNVGAITQIAYSNGQIWAGGESGLAIFREGRFHTAEMQGAKDFGMVAGIAGSPEFGLWLSTPTAIVHIPQSEIALLIQDWRHRVQYETFDPISDLPERPSDTSDTPAVMGTDGILWFATPRGVIRIDPAHLHRNVALPQLAIRSVTANGKSHSIYAPITLPPHTANLSIGYSVLSFPIPDRVRSRYRLLGYNNEWHDGGARVDAPYDNLGPGHYTFQVLASNNDGVWNEAATSLEFTIQPAFYQTIWFRFLYLLAGAILVWLLYRLRLRHVANIIKQRAETRADERVRIARDLHDTLLQGVQGLMLHFHVAAQELPQGSRTRESMERALATADRVVVEGRNRISRLRAEHLTPTNLVDAFEAVAADLNQEQQTRFALDIEGQGENINSAVLHELYYIGREAITNAFRHSEATEIAVKLNCGLKSVALTVTDNGCGFDPVAQETNPRGGHWGLQGMRERADAIGAEFKYQSGEHKGTQVMVTVPARRAYDKRPASSAAKK